MARALLYNLTGKPKTAKLRAALLRAGVSACPVDAKDYSQSLGYLAGREGFAALPAYRGVGFSDEMMVMCDFSSRQINEVLEQLRAAKAVIPLKAVLTETNAGWDSLQLHKEIRAEHEAMQKLRAGEKSTPIHQG